MTADYTFSEDTVLVASTGELAIGATGVLRATLDGPALPIYDLNGSPLNVITVGPVGVHQAFKADVAYGLLDFGSAKLTKVSDEAIASVITMQADVQSALSQVAVLQTSKAGVDHLHDAADITDFDAAVLAVPGIGSGGGSVGFVDGGTPTSTFSDTIIDGGAP